MFIGTKSGFKNTTGYQNTFIGHMAGYSNTTGEHNVFIGYDAGSETTGSYNTIINSVSGYYTGSNNIIIGGGYVCDDLLNGTVLSNGNVGSGGAITDNAVTVGNLLLGKQSSAYGAGQLVVNGTLRSSHIYPLKTSDYPSYDIGSSAARWNKLYVKDIDMTGSFPSIFVQGSGKYFNSNVFNCGIYSNIGATAASITSGICGQVYGGSTFTSTTTAYGVYGRANISGTSQKQVTNNRGVYGYAYGDYANNNYGVYGYAQSSTSKNNYGVYGYAKQNGTSNAYGVYGTVAYSSTTSSNALFAGYGVYSDGKAGGTTAWSSSSDARLKKDVQTLTGALDKVLKLRGVSFYWKNREELAALKGVPADSLVYGYDSQKHIGVIAQELEKEYPELVNTDGDGFKSVEYSTLVPILIEAMKEQQAIIDAQNKKIEELEAKAKEVDELKAQMKEILEKLK